MRVASAPVLAAAGSALFYIILILSPVPIPFYRTVAPDFEQYYAPVADNLWLFFIFADRSRDDRELSSAGRIGRSTTRMQWKLPLSCADGSTCRHNGPAGHRVGNSEGRIAAAWVANSASSRI